MVRNMHRAPGGVHGEMPTRSHVSRHQPPTDPTPGVKTFYREPIEIPSGHSFRVLRWQNNLREIEHVISPQRSVRIEGEGTHWHYHKAMELTLITSGEGMRFVGDRMQPFAAGDLVLLGEHLPHYWHARGPLSGISLQWHFPLAHPFWVFPEAERFDNYFQSAARGIHLTGETARRVELMMRQVPEAEGLHRLGLLFSILAASAAAREGEHAFISENSVLLSNESRHQLAMQAAVRYVLIHFREQITLPQILEVTRMSKPTFSRQFRARCGKTLSDFIQQVRIDAVCHELIKTDHPIVDVALANGFSHISFFNKAFRRAMKCSPSEYRARYKDSPAGG
jgi:AraC-like DNA-binding protein